MGSTAAIALGDVAWKKISGNKKGYYDVPGLLINKLTAVPPMPTPGVPPSPPSAWDATVKSSQAMTDAARRYRRQAGQGLASTTINGAVGDPTAAPTFRKQLLGR